MSEVINEGYFYNYEGNHVMFPMLLTFLYLHKNKINYWNTAFFAFSFVAFWELLEFSVGHVFGSFFIFGPDNEASETVEDIIILDLGNGIIGICIGLLTIATLQPSFKVTSWWFRALLFLVYGLVYSILSPYGICRGKCPDSLYVPYGNIANYFVILMFGFTMNKYVVDSLLVYAFIFNAFIFNTATLIRFQSSVIMVYVASAFLLISWTLYYYLINRHVRTERTSFTPLKTQLEE